MAVEWFQEPDSYAGEAYSTQAALAGAAARPGGLQASPAGLSTYGVPGLAQAPGGIDALPGPGANSSWVAAHQLPGYGTGYGVGAAVAPVGVQSSPAAASASSASSAATDPTAGVDAAWKWVLAWVVVLALGILIIRTQVGYRLVYYGLALCLLFLLLTNYQWVATALAPINQGAQQPGGLLG